MGSRFDDAFALTGGPALIHEHGQTVTYTTTAGVSSSISMIVGDPERNFDYAGTGQKELWMCTASCLASAVASPANLAKVTIDGDVWTVMDYTPAGAMIDFTLEREIQITHASPGFQGRRNNR